MDAPETLLEAVQYFSDSEAALKFLVDVRWPKGVACPHCGSRKVTYLANAKVWKCKTAHPRQKFSAKVGTIFEDSPIGLDKWLPAMWLAANCKNGISSYELHRGIGVTQKTAWFMLQRIRLAMHNGSVEKMSGTCEADETYIGAKARYMHKSRRTGVGHAGLRKTAVQGILERTTAKRASRVVLKVVPNTRRPELCGNVREYVLKGSTVCTDALMSYDDLESDYDRQVIDHAISYANGHVHTNALENFWSLLKRALKGTYVNVEPFHLFRYLDEQAFRYNERKNKDGDKGRFILALQGVVGKGLKYAKLIAAEGGDGPYPTETWQTT
jgi:5-methylcytosine-specific restriction endonuclease McrA